MYLYHLLTLSVFFINVKYILIIPRDIFLNQENKEKKERKKDCIKSLCKISKIFLKKKQKKSDNIVMNDTKIYQNVKNKSLLSIEKNIIECEKMYYNHMKVFKFRKFCFFIRNLIFVLMFEKVSQKMWKEIKRIFDFQVF